MEGKGNKKQKDQLAAFGVLFALFMIVASTLSSHPEIWLIIIPLVILGIFAYSYLNQKPKAGADPTKPAPQFSTEREVTDTGLYVGEEIDWELLP